MTLNNTKKVLLGTTISETGQCMFDDLSMTNMALGKLEKQVLDDKDDDFWTCLKNAKAAKEVNPNELTIN
ncbi:SNO4 protein-like [Schizosaccharomyces osmophilus]|uniref:SNO4 protein-like n=1 Tax=Schizosaccharomyces osmophilus TaxID=2545709 RepID=A0AAE9WBL1_9SCHI|nr:SNO4 protein-like [Schizosaccharomyces osmophilus]WBW72456.1 SNO4 protein-like [Schizosaccharomyces osmophilus]